MRILVNSTINPSGGGIQVAASFIHNAVMYGDDHNWFFLVSPQVDVNLRIEPQSENHRKVVIPVSPARIRSGRDSRRLMHKLEEEYKPDVVFTIPGVAYFNFQAPHLMFFALPWLTNPSKLAWSKLGGMRRRLRMLMYSRYVKYWVKFADQWILETQVAADGLAKSLNRDRSLFHVVPNCYSVIYSDTEHREIPTHPDLMHRTNDEYRLLVFSSYIRHKNLESIPETASQLKILDPHRKYVFVLTIKKDISAWKAIKSEAKRQNVEDYIVNIGPQPVTSGPALYKSCDALFLPTVLEVFTATYPEAMCMQKPIITSDLDFARDICRDAAFYFDPTNSKEAAEAIISVADDKNLSNKLVEAGRRRLDDFGTPRIRFDMYMDILNNLAK